MTGAEDRRADAALDTFVTGLDHLVKFVEDGALAALDHAGLVGFLQGIERFRNRLALVDHQLVRAAQQNDLAGGAVSPVVAAGVGGGAAGLGR